jgi:hypothetical protein
MEADGKAMSRFLTTSMKEEMESAFCDRVVMLCQLVTDPFNPLLHTAGLSTVAVAKLKASLLDRMPR